MMTPSRANRRKELAKVVKALGPKVQSLRKGGLAALREKTLDHVLRVFEDSPANTANASAAPFFLGRLHEAIVPLLDAKLDMERYDTALEKVKEIDEAIAEADRLAKQIELADKEGAQ